MIELTPLAAEKLTAIRASDPTHPMLRVYIAGNSCCNTRYGLAFDVAAEADDAVVERAGISVALDPATVEAARGATIDFVDSESGSGFVVRNPNAGGGCACGK